MSKNITWVYFTSRRKIQNSSIWDFITFNNSSVFICNWNIRRLRKRYKSSILLFNRSCIVNNLTREIGFNIVFCWCSQITMILSTNHAEGTSSKSINTESFLNYYANHCLIFAVHGFLKDSRFVSLHLAPFWTKTIGEGK